MAIKYALMIDNGESYSDYTCQIVGVCETKEVADSKVVAFRDYLKARAKNLKDRGMQPWHIDQLWDKDNPPPVDLGRWSIRSGDSLDVIPVPEYLQ